MTVPYTFATATTTLPLSQLDANFSAVGQSANVTYTSSLANAVSRTSQSKMSDIVSVKDFGAVGDGTTDDTTAIQNAFNASSSVYIPRGNYKITGTINWPIYLMSVFGDGPNASNFYITTNNPAILFNTNSNSFYYRNINNVGFVWNGGSTTRNNADGIRISGGSGNYIAYCRFENLGFFGVWAGINNIKTDSTGGENQFDWNLFTGLVSSNAGAYQTQYGFKGAYGSGTGNVFSNCNLVVGTAGISIGNGSANCGDLIFVGIQIGGSGSGFQLVGGSSYGYNISVTACQMDAGINPCLDFTNITGFKSEGNNWTGGGGYNNFTGLTGDYYQNGEPGNLGSNTSITRVAYDLTSNPSVATFGQSYNLMKTNGNVATGATVSQFTVTVPSAYKGAYAEYISQGLQQGVGYRYRKTVYWIVDNGSGITVTVSSTEGNDSGFVHAYSVVGTVVTLKTTTNSTSIDSTISGMLNVFGSGISASRS